MSSNLAMSQSVGGSGESGNTPVPLTSSRLLAVRPPTTSLFPMTSTLGGATPSIAETGEGLLCILSGAGGEAHVFRPLPVALESQPFRVAGRMSFAATNAAGAADGQVGILLRLSDNDFVRFGLLCPWSNNGQTRFYVGGKAGGVNMDWSYGTVAPGPDLWLACASDGAGGLAFEYSPDGRTWIPVYQHTLSALGFVPTHYGFAIYSPAGATQTAAVIPAFYSTEYPMPDLMGAGLSLPE